MALNYLFSRHQLSMMRATSAPSAEARIVHRALAKGYAERIRALQVELGAVSPMAQAA